MLVPWAMESFAYTLFDSFLKKTSRCDNYEWSKCQKWFPSQFNVIRAIKLIETRLQYSTFTTPTPPKTLTPTPPENSCVDINNNENLPPTPFCKHTHSIAMLYYHHPLIPPFNRLFFEKIEGMFFLLWRGYSYPAHLPRQCISHPDKEEVLLQKFKAHT